MAYLQPSVITPITDCQAAAFQSLLKYTKSPQESLPHMNVSEVSCIKSFVQKEMERLGLLCATSSTSTTMEQRAEGEVDRTDSFLKEQKKDPFGREKTKRTASLPEMESKGKAMVTSMPLRKRASASAIEERDGRGLAKSMSSLRSEGERRKKVKREIKVEKTLTNNVNVIDIINRRTETEHVNEEKDWKSGCSQEVEREEVDEIEEIEVDKVEEIEEVDEVKVGNEAVVLKSASQKSRFFSALLNELKEQILMPSTANYDDDDDRCHMSEKEEEPMIDPVRSLGDDRDGCSQRPRETERRRPPRKERSNGANCLMTPSDDDEMEASKDLVEEEEDKEEATTLQIKDSDGEEEEWTSLSWIVGSDKNKKREKQKEEEEERDVVVVDDDDDGDDDGGVNDSNRTLLRHQSDSETEVSGVEEIVGLKGKKVTELSCQQGKEDEDEEDEDEDDEDLMNELLHKLVEKEEEEQDDDDDDWISSDDDNDER